MNCDKDQKLLFSILFTTLSILALLVLISRSPEGVLTYPQRTHSACCFQAKLKLRKNNFLTFFFGGGIFFFFGWGKHFYFFIFFQMKLKLKKNNFLKFFWGRGDFLLGRGQIFLKFFKSIFFYFQAKLKLRKNNFLKFFLGGGKFFGNFLSQFFLFLGEILIVKK